MVSLTRRRRIALRRLMRRHKLTAVKAGEILNRKPQTIRCYLCGVRRISAEQYRTLMLVTGEGL